MLPAGVDVATEEQAEGVDLHSQTRASRDKHSTFAPFQRTGAYNSKLMIQNHAEVWGLGLGLRLALTAGDREGLGEGDV